MLSFREYLEETRTLSIPELDKYNGIRYQVFANKVKSGSSFKLKNGSEAKVGFLDKKKTLEFAEKLLSDHSNVLLPYKKNKTWMIPVIINDEETFLNINQFEKTYEFGGQSKGKKLDATVFEEDLVNAINGSDALTKNGEDGKIKARLIVDAMRKDGIKMRSAMKVSGVPSPKNLTPLYIENNVTNGEPKADIAIDGVGISVKQFEASQIASAQGVETFAVIDAAIGNKVSKNLRSSLRKVITQSFDKKNFYDIRNSLENSNIGKAPEANNIISGLLGLISNKKKKEINQKQFDIIKSEIIDKTNVSEKLLEEVKSILEDPANRSLMFKEFVSGEKRFVNDNHIAKNILAWSSMAEGKYFYSDVDSYVKSHSNSFSFSIRDRGTNRGGAFRLQGSFSLHENTLNEGYELANEICNTLLTEGIIEKGKEIVSNIKNYIAIIYSFFIGLLKSGMNNLMKFLGLECDIKVKYSF